jgi:alkylation response protein AidB-like acyl-CoA dehydrogenase
MDFELTEEQQMIKTMARDFREKEIDPYVAEYDKEERFPVEIALKMGELGMLGGVIPEQYGGAAMTYMNLVVLIEEISRSCHILGATISFPSGLAGSSLLFYGSEEQKQKYLVPYAQGKIFAGAGVTEPHSGTDVAGMETVVVKKGDDYIVNGAKTWISFLEHASWFITFAQMDKSKGRRGICAFIIEPSWPGVSIRPFKNKVGYRPVSTGELFFEDVRVPKENLVGQEGQGFYVAMCSVENGRMAVASRALGVIQSCIDESLKYARDRVTFGQPIGRYQLIQNKITDMVIGLETSRFLTYKLAWLKDQGVQRAQFEASMAKLHATDVLMKTATDAVQIHGAYGCSDEYPVGRYFRDAKFFQMVEGTTELHRILVAEHALGYRKN